MLRISCVLCLVAVIVGCRDYQSPTAAMQSSINERGTVLARKGVKAVVLEDGVIWELGWLGSTVRPAAINQRGDAVGLSFLSPDSFAAHAVLWRRIPALAAAPSA